MLFRLHRSTKSILIVIFGLAIALACTLSQAIQENIPLFNTTPIDDSFPVDQPGLPSWVEVYFTEPDTDQTRGGPDSPLATAISAAQLSVDVAAYELDLWSMRDALLQAHRNGVAVRVVSEKDNPSRELDELVSAGIAVVSDRSDGLMHNKFVIIDQMEVWTGSMNYTLSDTYRNNNNLIRIENVDLATAYTTEFEEMFTDQQFGGASPVNTVTHQIIQDGSLIEVYFGPEDDAANRLVTLIGEAQESIHFMAFSFTADELANAILAQATSGVPVTGIMDEDQALNNIGGDYHRFIDAGLEVYLDGNPNKMHHKVIVIDQDIIITGSYNFSKSAEERNDENIVIIHNAQVAGIYLQEFESNLELANP